MWNNLLSDITEGNTRSLARCISLVENEFDGYQQLLKSLNPHDTKVLGITGPPGAGKSTLTDALIEQIINEKKKVGVLCVDPSSPFNLGALLGDRIRMSRWYNHPDVFIRSLASRGSLGGLHPKILEIIHVMQCSSFDYIIVETVGVGQSEVEIAGLADITIVVLVPEAGDEIQTMKAGLMEVADIFVVNKADRPDADLFVKNLQMMVGGSHDTYTIPVVKTVASKQEGLEILYKHIEEKSSVTENNERKYLLMAEKAFQLIQQHRMKDIDKKILMQQLKDSATKNVYQFIQSYI
ncbi:MAG: methylmalonyl Co-A mutase-associated GTPase MeaB [Bacteroidota bacterium]